MVPKPGNEIDVVHGCKWKDETRNISEFGRDQQHVNTIEFYSKTKAVINCIPLSIV